MKRLLVTLTLSLLTFYPIYAQYVDDSLRFAESIWAMEKKAMILEQMDLTEAEKSSFWPVYESYSNAVQYLDMEYIRMQNLTEEDMLLEKESGSLTEHMLLNELLLAKTRKYYFKRFKKALSPSQAGKFMHLDQEFRTMLRIQMQKDAPAIVSSLNRLYLRN